MGKDIHSLKYVGSDMEGAKDCLSCDEDWGGCNMGTLSDDLQHQLISSGGVFVFRQKS